MLNRFIYITLAAISLSCWSGCGSLATRKAFYQPITAELVDGKSDKATELLEKALEDKKFGEKDRLLYFLDAGLLNHYAGDYQTSNIKLHLAEQVAEDLFTKSVSKAALSLLLNDNALDYAGEDYEILYANLIKALNYAAMDDFDNAFVEIRRANLKLESLEQKYNDAARAYREGASDDTTFHPEYTYDSVRFHNDAFARYLSMHLYAADGKLDDARIDYDLLTEAFQTQAHIYSFEPPAVRYHSEDKAILSIVGLAGLSPTKEGLILRLRTDKDLDLVQVMYTSPDREGEEYSHFVWPVGEDYYFKFGIPVITPRYSEIVGVEVLIDGQSLGELQLIENVSKVAEETFRAKKSLIYLRTIARVFAKGLAAHKAKKKADSGGLGGWLKKAAIDVTSDLTENPDLRSSQFLPGQIYVGDFELTPGQYDLSIVFKNAEGIEIARTEYPGYTVLESGLNLVEAASAR